MVQRGQLVVLESTTYPGTTRERLLPLLERRGLRAGDGLNVAFSPERVDPGRSDYTMRNTPKVVGGIRAECSERAAEMYSRICDRVVRVTSPEVAEMTKLLENIFRSVNIALVNEVSILADRMGIDIWEVIDAAATKPYGLGVATLSRPATSLSGIGAAGPVGCGSASRCRDPRRGRRRAA